MFNFLVKTKNIIVRSDRKLRLKSTLDPILLVSTIARTAGRQSCGIGRCDLN